MPCLSRQCLPSLPPAPVVHQYRRAIARYPALIRSFTSPIPPFRTQPSPHPRRVCPHGVETSHRSQRQASRSLRRALPRRSRSPARPLQRRSRASPLPLPRLRTWAPNRRRSCSASSSVF
ncbi:hypothetical protein C8Q78DRAFT_1055358 [Trametes maxima]|nr:hypothetical protein C8Q78DRAFT_1055358 [Trametes maxima]